MTYNVENLEKSTVKITITVPTEDFEKAVTESYERNKGKYEIPGFRKGKAPKSMLEKTYGESLFYEDAFNSSVDHSYTEVLDESKLDVVSRPEIEIVDCGKGKDFVYTATVAVRPEVKLGKYKGVEVEKTSADVSDEEVDNEIKAEQNRNSRLVPVTGRAAQLGDTVRIDFDGSVDGVHFEGGKGEDYPLELGSHSFVDTFEDQIVGHNIGDEFDVNVTFPENYGGEQLSGKAAVFACKLNDIKQKELPELDDEFASEVSEFETFAEYKESVKAKLVEAMEKRAKIENENKVVDAIVAASEVELPDLMIASRLDSMVEDYKRRMQSQGLNFDEYLKYTGNTIDAFKEQMKPQAEKDLKSSLVLEAIAKAEDIPVTDADFDEEINKMAVAYKMNPEDIKKFFSDDDNNSIKEDIKIRKAIDMLVNEASFK